MVALERSLVDLDQWSPRRGVQDNPLGYRKKVFFILQLNTFLKFKIVFIASLSHPFVIPVFMYVL